MSHLLDVRLADIINAASRDVASDIHIVPGAIPTARVDGILRRIPGATVSADDVEAIATSLFSGNEMRLIRTGADVSTTVLDNGLSLRVHAGMAESGLTLAFRLLRRSVPTIEELQLPKVVASLSKRLRGLIIFCGATGSGKSSSLAAIVHEINVSQARRIVTIEDPIEYRHENELSLISQREIGRDVRSFASGVSGILRADPDVIVIGEIRDVETMRAALTAAETGHLVLTTLHSGSAVQAVDRIVDAMDNADKAYVRSQLSAALTAVLSQRLVPCARSSGRRPVMEILIVTDGIRSMIRDGRNHLIENVIASGRRSGMQTFEQHMRELVSSGEILPQMAGEAGY